MEIFGILSLIFFSFELCIAVRSSRKYYGNNTDEYLNTVQIIQKYGYPSEAHTITTADGYLLTLHRIPNVNRSNKKFPIYIQHGFLGSSVDFFLLQRNSLAFLLADLGYDVWLGNVRGNLYSRAHANLFPDERTFWNFTWHDSAMYDLPAGIDYILKHTNQEKINYVGYSMGTTMFFVLTSTLPEYNQKIESAFLLGAVAYVKNIKSPIIQYMTKINKVVDVMHQIFANGEFLPEDKELKRVLKRICLRHSFKDPLCMSSLYLMVGYNPDSISKSQLSIVLGHFPKGSSVRTMQHFSQLHLSGEFEQYDYGEKGNLIKYGTSRPPDYNVCLITTPIYIYQGKNDYMATVEDIRLLEKKLFSLKELNVIEYKKFNHMDFVTSTRAIESVYNSIIQKLKR